MPPNKPLQAATRGTAEQRAAQADIVVNQGDKPSAPRSFVRNIVDSLRAPDVPQPPEEPASDPIPEQAVLYTMPDGTQRDAFILGVYPDNVVTLVVKVGLTGNDDLQRAQFVAPYDRNGKAGTWREVSINWRETAP